MDEIAGKKLIVIGDYFHDAMPSLNADPILRIGICEGNDTYEPDVLLNHFDVVTLKNSLAYVAEVIPALSKNI